MNNRLDKEDIQTTHPLNRHVHPHVSKAVLALLVIVGIGAILLTVSSLDQRQNSRSRAAGAEATVPATIASDCSVDVTTQLNDWIKTVPDGSTLTFPATACYRIDETVEFFNRNNLTLEGNGVTFKAVTDGRETDKPRARSHLRFISGSNIIVRNVIVRGANPNAGLGDTAYVAELEAQHGFDLGGVQTILLDNVEAYDVYGDFVYVGPYRIVPSVPSRNVTVRNSKFDRNGRQGIAITSAEHVLIENNTLGNMRRAAIDIEPNTTDLIITDIRVANNQFGRQRLLFLANNGAPVPHTDIVFENNFVGAPLKIGVGGPSGTLNRKGYKFINNVSNDDEGNPGGVLWHFTGVDGLEVRGNTQPAEVGRNMYLVGIWESRNVRVTDNRAQWTIGSLRIGGDQTLSSNYCNSNNLIGSPLTAELSNFPCPPDPNIPSFTSPANGASLTGTVTIAASAPQGARLELYDGSEKKGEDPDAPYTFTWDTKSSIDGNHILTLKSYLGGETKTSSGLYVTTDNNPPSTPTGLRVVATSRYGIDIAWNPSTDSSPVSYYVFRNGVQIALSGQTIFSDRTATDRKATYTYTVQAVDLAGQKSQMSAPITASIGSGSTKPGGRR